MSKKKVVQAPIKLHNNYKAKLVNKEGVVTKEGYAENIVLNKFWTNATKQGEPTRFIASKIGTGRPVDGVNVDPDATDLYNGIGEKIVGTDIEITSSLTGLTRTTTKKMTVTFPATEEYVGEITEIATFSDTTNYSRINSLALFKDSEGLPISINKTAEDNLIVEVTIYIIVNYPSGSTPKEEMDSITNRILNSENNGFLYEDIPISLTAMSGSIGNYIEKDFESFGIIGINSSRNSSIDILEREIKYDKLRASDSVGNLGFANYITLRNCFSIPLPNEDYFPSYIIADLDVASGNGSKVSFDCPIPEFKLDTETIKIDGVPLTRGVDYELSNSNNSLAYASSMASHSTEIENIDFRDSRSDRSVFLYKNPNYSLYSADEETTIEFSDEILVESIIVPDGTMQHSYSKLTLSYSEDGLLYTPVIELTGEEVPVINDLEEPVTAKFWKLTQQRGYSSTTGEPVSFGKKPSQLVLTTPPTLGSNITITCEVDRPFKSKDFIFDASYIVGY